MMVDDDHFMRDPDTLAWNMEHDPGLRSTLVAIAWLDERPDVDVLTTRLECATRRIPRFRQRLVPTPGGLAAPRWVDCQFDLSLHLRRIGAPAPYSPETVLEYARSEAMTGFDPTRPLWQVTLVEGLEGDRAALIMKVHHSLTDGVGGVQLAMLVFEASPVSAPIDEVPVPLAEPMPSSMDLALGAINHDLGRAVRTARTAVAQVGPVAGSIVRHPLRTVLDVAATVSSLGRFVPPASDPLSPIMTRRGLDRRLDLFEVDLADLESAGSVVGGTLDDAFVASVTGGLRRYHELHDAPVENLRVTMPIPLQRGEPPDADGRITLERFVVPVAGSDTGTRVKTTGWQCRAARYEEALPLSDAVAGILNLLPSGLVGSMFKHVDFLATNVPGVPEPIYLAGAPVSGYYIFGPTTGTAVNVTLVSYQGTCCVGCTVDTAAVPDPDELVASLRGGFDEVLGLGGAHHPVRPLLANRLS